MASKEHVEFSVRVPLEHYKDLNRLAEENDRTLAAQVRVAIRAFLLSQAKS